MYGKRQQVLVFKKNFLEADTVANNHISLAENRARKMTAIRAAEYLDQVFFTFKIARQLMNQLNAFHETPCFHI